MTDDIIQVIIIQWHTLESRISNLFCTAYQSSGITIHPAETYLEGRRGENKVIFEFYHLPQSLVTITFTFFQTIDPPKTPNYKWIFLVSAASYETAVRHQLRRGCVNYVRAKFGVIFKPSRKMSKMMYIHCTGATSWRPTAAPDWNGR